MKEIFSTWRATETWKCLKAENRRSFWPTTFWKGQKCLNWVSMHSFYFGNCCVCYCFKRLRRDFGILLSWQDAAIVPILPLRLNFLHYSADFVAKIALCVDFRAIDLGCGPYAIMAMLSHKIFAWRGICIESDPESRNLARQNIAANFDSGIEMIVHEPSPDRLLPRLETNGTKCGDKRIRVFIKHGDLSQIYLSTSPNIITSE